jgi:hypothetical protein
LKADTPDEEEDVDDEIEERAEAELKILLVCWALSLQKCFSDALLSPQGKSQRDPINARQEGSQDEGPK